ncbi:MAG: putative Outer rane chaperone Skp (OmpH) precursor [Deltaproteobacteria bacterium]|nr:putative Outer rane chaperone Skp (OmpH) precursor [Deltaproteobacteria bacterium]
MRPVWLMVAALAVANVAWAESAPKIGFVDMQRALLETDAGKKAQQELKDRADKAQSKLKKQKDEIDGLRERLEKQASAMKAEERATLEEDYRKKARTFDNEVQDSQAELQKKEKELTGAILKDLQAIILEYGQEQNYTVILGTDTGAVVYGAKSADVTDTIVQRYNSGQASKKKEK